MGKQDIDRLIDRVGLAEAAKQRQAAGVLFTYRCSINCRHCWFSFRNKQLAAQDGRRRQGIADALWGPK